VRKTKLRVVGLCLALCLTGMAVIAGCSADKSRAASERLMEEVGKAVRLYERAAALMANPIHGDAGTHEVAPLPGDPFAIDANQLEKYIELPDLPVNPKAMADLKKAHGDLSAAMKDPANAEADQNARALACQMLARIDVLTGCYSAVEGSVARLRAGALLSKTEAAAMVCRDQSRLIDFHRLLAPPEGGSFETTLTDASARKLAKEKEIEDGNQAVTLLSEDIRKLSEDIAQKKAGVEKLRQESREMRGEEGLKKFREALTITLVVGEKSRENAEKQEKLKELTAKLEQDKQALTAIEAKIKLADQGKKDNKTAKDAFDGQQKARLSALAEAKKEAETLAGEVGKECAKARSAEEAALSAYEAALQDANDAQALLTGDQATENLAEQANIHMRIGELFQQRLEVQVRGRRVIALMGGAEIPSSAPSASAPATSPAAKGIQDYLPRPDEARQTAKGHFEDAIDLCTKAMEGQKRDEVRWLYQGQLASACLGLYRVTGNDDAYKKAVKALDDALGGGRSGSPYLTDVKRLRELAEGLKAAAGN